MSGHGQNFNSVLILKSVNVVNTKLCMMILLVELYPFTSLSVTSTLFQLQSEILCSYLFTSLSATSISISVSVGNLMFLSN